MNLEKIIKALKYVPVVVIIFFGKLKFGKKENSESEESSQNEEHNIFQQPGVIMETSFIDELLQEVDQVIKEIGDRQKEIERTLVQAEEEKQLIQDWALTKCDKIQSKIDWMTKKLENGFQLL